MKKLLVPVMVVAALFAADANAKSKHKATPTPAAQDNAATDGKQSKRKSQFEKMDANHDGVVDKAEFDAYYNGRFTKLDKNKDGKLTKDEMPVRKKSSSGN